LTANANGAIANIDGVAVTAGMRLLVKNEATASHNGIYTVTQVGTGGTPYILTRVTDFNTAATMVGGSKIYVWQGTTNGNTEWAMNVTGAITVGTTSLTFTQFAAAVSSVTMGGDVTGNSATSTVAKINGATLGTTTATSGNILVASAGNAWTSVAMSGDATIVASGALTIANNAITNVKVAAAAAIAVSKLAAGTSGQILLNSATPTPTWTTMGGDATIGATGTLTLATVNSNVGTFGSAIVVPTVTVNGKGLTTAVSTNPIQVRTRHQFSNPTQVNSTVGLMAKHWVTGATNLGTTDPSNLLQNGGVDPYIALNNCTIDGIQIQCSQAAVNNGTVGATPTVRIDFYTMTAGARTLLGTTRIPISPAGSVQASNNLGVNATFTGSATGLGLSLTAGQAWGIQFTNETTNNNTVNAVGRLFAVVDTQEDAY
jgi:hypothetical protein